jgi:FkbM family methyltransferase
MQTRALDQLLQQARDRFGLVEDYEVDQLSQMAAILQGATRFVDVGANRGIYAYVANALMRNGRIVLIEADPRLAERLGATVPDWMRETDNGNEITVLATAAGDQDCVMPFQVGPEETLGSLTGSDFLTGGTARVGVSVKPLDALLPPGPGTVFKIDVEGFEYRVLDGARQHLAQPDAKLLLELHGWGDSSIGRYPHHVFSLMRRAGYKALKTSGREYIFLFSRSDRWGAWASFLRFAPLAWLKSLARRAGLRPLYHRVRARIGLGSTRDRSGLAS